MQWDALDGARAAYRHEGAARALVHALKYGRVRAIAQTIAPEIARLLAAEQLTVAFPVPLHRRRVRSRGFNQAEAILRHLALETGHGKLVRTRRTRSQVGLGLAARRGNVAGAFEYRGERLAGARVALIDDVLTTGATANECARVLKDFGASQVIAVTFARANPPTAAYPAGDR
ncbi:MAG: ComF family protein [Dehalococcoidia bacterium]